jgi:phage gp16-like protein
MLPEGKMSTEEKMNIDERRKYLRMMRRRYEQARRQECKQLLDEMEAVTGLHRHILFQQNHHPRRLTQPSLPAWQEGDDDDLTTTGRYIRST